MQLPTRYTREKELNAKMSVFMLYSHNPAYTQLTITISFLHTNACSHQIFPTCLFDERNILHLLIFLKLFQ